MIQSGFQRSFSMGLELSFLSSKIVRALLRVPHITDNDRRLFSRGAQFFSQALKGKEAVKTLRVTSSAAEEARTYHWGINALATLVAQLEVDQDIKGIFVTFRDILVELGAAEPDGSTIEQEEIEKLRDFFLCMREIANKSDTVPFDSVHISA